MPKKHSHHHQPASNLSQTTDIPPLSSSIYKFLQFLRDATGDVLETQKGTTDPSLQQALPLDLRHQLNQEKDLLLSTIYDMTEHVLEQYENPRDTKRRRHERRKARSSEQDNEEYSALFQSQVDNFQLRKQIHALKHKLRKQEQDFQEKLIEQQMSAQRKWKEVDYRVRENHRVQTAEQQEHSFIVPQFTERDLSGKSNHRDSMLSQSVDHAKLRSLRERTSNPDVLFTESLRLYLPPRAATSRRLSRDQGLRSGSMERSSGSSGASKVDTHTIKIKLPPAEMLPFVNEDSLVSFQEA